MTLDRYADFQRRTGHKVRRVNDIWWRQVRPFFWRPLMPFYEYASSSVQPPTFGVLGGIQHVVPKGEPANSSISFLMFEDASRYHLDLLDYNRKRQVRLASKHFQIRPMRSPEELASMGHNVYLSFYERTRYAFLADRCSPAKFQEWCEILFCSPDPLVWGAFRGEVLCAVSVSHIVEDSWHYATFFSDSTAMKQHVSDLMLHSVRQMAADLGGLKQVFAGLYHGGQGTDEFYLLRGARLLNRPARLWLNPVAEILLRCFRPVQYAQLFGRKTLGRASGSVSVAENEAGADSRW